MTREKLSIAIVLALIAAALAMTALGFAGYRSPADLRHPLFAAPMDGSWTAIAIDGKTVEPERYRIGIDDGAVTGGRDDCNDWSYGERRGKHSDRLILTTLQSCPEDDPLREAYWALVYDPDIALRPDGRLLIRGQGHQAVLIRCSWKQVRDTLPDAGESDRMRCLPEEARQRRLE